MPIRYDGGVFGISIPATGLPAFPLDIIEDGGEHYYWCIYRICPKYQSLRHKLVPLIDKLEKIFDREFFREYIDASRAAQRFYLPLINHQYEKIREFRKIF